MKLGEALVRRKQLGQEITALMGQVKQQPVRASDGTPVKDANGQINKLSELITEKAVLEQQINNTNIQTKVEFMGHTVSVMQLISERDAIRLRESIYRDLAGQIKTGLNRNSYLDREHQIGTVTDYDLEQIQGIQQTAAKLGRELDTKLQETNWTADLIEA